MGRTKGTYTLTSNIEPKVGAPLDARTVVPLKTDLTASGTFDYPYIGLSVFVREDNKRYTLIGADPTVVANWREEGSGTSTSADHVTYDNRESGLESVNIQDAVDEIVGDLGSAAYKDIPESGDADETQVVMGSDTRLTDSRPASDVYDWAKAATKPTYTKSEVGLDNVDNTSDATKKTNFTGSIASGDTGFVTGGDAYTALNGKLDTSLKGVANGLAELDSAGKVPSSQLPSYVDDVIEVDDYAHLPITGESGKIYVTKDTNKTYRWSGTGYVEISESLALGNTHNTAFYGDWGEDAYNHASDSGKVTTAVASGFYKVAATSEGHIAGLTAVQKSDITALGIPDDDTKVTQTETSTNADYEVLFSGTADNTTRTEGAGKAATLRFNPSKGSLMEGQSTVANGDYSHAEGICTCASGKGSHAEGGYNKDEIIQGTFATGQNSHAEGYLTTAKGIQSHAEGTGTYAAEAHSHAEGNGTTASDYNSHAEGYQTFANATEAHAEGIKTTANGGASHAEGSQALAFATNSHAEGSSTTARGSNSHAEGQYTYTSGSGSHAEGYKTTASGIYTHAEGNTTCAANNSAHAEGSNTTASGTISHAEGEYTCAGGSDSHAEGYRTTARGADSHAEGNYTYAAGQNSHAEGLNTTALGNNSHATGQYTCAAGTAQTVVGKYNTPDTTSLFIVGNGTSTSAKSNALAVGSDGTTTLGASGTITSGNTQAVTGGAVYDALQALPSDDTKVTQTATTTDANYEVLFSETADNTTRTEGAKKAATLRFNPSKGAIMEGNGTVASGYYSHAEGDYTTAKGGRSHAEGYYTYASGSGAHAEGGHGDDEVYSIVGTFAIGENAHAEGFLTTAYGANSHAEGRETIAEGDYSHAEGCNTCASDRYSHAEGIGTVSSGGFGSHAEGYDTVASGSRSHAEGQGTKASASYSHAEGFLSSAITSSSHAEGDNAVASGNSSHAEGYKTTASGAQSHAAGRFTCAAGTAQTVVGKYNIADTTSLFIVGNGTANDARSNAMSVDSTGNLSITKINGTTVGNDPKFTDTYDKNRYNANIKAWDTALVSGNIIVAGSNGTYHHLKEGTAFDIRYPILYLAEAVAANGTTTNTYDIIGFTVTTTQSITLTAYQPVYIKGTLNGPEFTPISTAPLTQIVPTYDDTYRYILLGIAYSTTAIYLQERHTIYAFKDGSFKEYAAASWWAKKAEQDSDGNAINSTYIKKNSGTANASLTIYKETTTSADDPALLYFSVKDTTTGLTYSNSYIAAYNDHGTSATNGNNLLIRPGGALFIGSGEAPSGHYAAIKPVGNENTYITADTHLYLQASGNSNISNRKGFVINTSQQLVPVVADTVTNNVGSLGAASYNIGSAYINTIYEGGTALSSKYAASGHNHDATYVKKSGDTMTGLLTTNEGITTKESLLVQKKDDVEWTDQGTNEPAIIMAGAENKNFKFKFSNYGKNVDIGWDWTSRDGAGAFFRQADAPTSPGAFGFFARNATQNVDFLAYPDGRLLWNNRRIVTSTNGSSVGGETTPVYVNASGNVTALNYTIGKSVPDNAVFTDTTYSLTNDGASVKLTPSAGSAMSVSLNTLINALSIGTDTPKDADYVVMQYANGGTTTTTYHRKSVSTIWNYVKGKIGISSGDTFLKKDGTWATPTDTTYTFVGGNNSFTVTPSGGSAQTVSLTISDSTKVAKAGDTMTGNLTIQKSNPNILLNNTNALATGSTAAALTLKLKTADGSAAYSTDVIGFIGTNTGDGNNIPVRIGSSNGTTIISAGEAGVNFASKNSKFNDENIYLVSDSSILLYKDTANDGTISTGPLEAAGFTGTITSGRVVVSSGTRGGLSTSAYTIATSVPSNAVFTDTHRPIQVNGTEVLGNNTTALNLKQGDNVTITNSSGTVTIAATDTKYTAATAAPGNVASSSAVGTSTNYARQDHTHGISLATGDNFGQVKIAGTNVQANGYGKRITAVNTGSGTTAQDKGSGVSPRYFPAKWTFNTGLTAANGDIFTIRIPCAGHSYGVFLSVDNGANYYPISVTGTSRLTTHYPNGYNLVLVFNSSGSTASIYPVNGGDATTTVSGGCWYVLNYYDSGNSNTYDRNRFNGTIKISSAVDCKNGNIIVGKDGVYTHLKQGTAFDITYPILYLAEDKAKNGTTTNTYDIIHFTVTTTQSISLIAYKPVYIKGTLGGTIFTPVSTTPLTQTEPASEDGYWYIYLGMATSTTTVYLQEVHTIYRYYAGSLKSCVGVSYYTNKATGDSDGNQINTTYLKKSGGTMTGALTMLGGQYDDATPTYALDMNNSNIVGLNSIYTKDSSGDACEGIHFYRDATHVDTLWMNAGDLLFVPNRALGTATSKADSQKVGRFTANPTSGQVVITDGTTGGMKSSGYTIAKSVPSSAVFTDTTYTIETGDSNGQIKVTPSSGNAYPVSVKGLGSAAYKNTTDTYSATGTDVVTGKAVAAALGTLPEPMVFKGSLGTGGTITALPVDGTATVGDTYKVITAGTYASKAAKVGDTFICNSKTSSANTWELIPSGDEPSGTVTSVAVSNGGGLSVSGSPITSSGTITISHSDTSSQASVSNSGRTYIQSVTLDTYGHVTKLTSATETVTNTDRYVNSASFAHDSTNNNVKMTLTRAGSDTQTVTGNIPLVSSSTAGVAPKGAAVSSQSQSTKFLREDGTWAAPSYTTNSDTLVTQSSTTTSNWRKIALGAQNDSAAGTAVSAQTSQVYVTPSLEFRPSTGTLKSTILSASDGLSLFTDYNPQNYGIVFVQTSTMTNGLHGYVRGNYATYFTMKSSEGTTTTDRGWIFRDKTTTSSIASINQSGNAVFNGSVTVGGNSANTSGCRMVYDSTNECMNLEFVS